MADAGPLLPPLHELDDEPALRFAHQTLSYGELREAAGAVAAQVGEAQRVGIWAESTLEASVGVVGALAAGATVVPVNPKLGETELRHVLEDSNPEMLFRRARGCAGCARPAAASRDRRPDRAR